MNVTDNITAILNNSVGLDINEYMRTALIIAASFITVAGIILALGSKNERFSKPNKNMLFFSILFGAVAMSTVLKWYDNNTLLGFGVDSVVVKEVIGVSLFLQFFLWFFPLLGLFPTVEHAKNKNNDKKQQPDQPEAQNRKVTLSEIKKILVEFNKRLDAIENRQKSTAWQWLFSLGVSAFAVGTSWIIATTTILPGDYSTGLIVLFVGLIIMGLALLYSNRKKTN
jgi:hypothetical protein